MIAMHLTCSSVRRRCRQCPLLHPPATVPRPCAQLLGLCDVKLPLHQAVEGAYEELMNAKPLEEGYRWGRCTSVPTALPFGAAPTDSAPNRRASPNPCPPHRRILPLHPPARRSELARLGKEKILKAARDRLLRSGRTSLLSPTVQVEPLLLPGAMALLHQVCGATWGGAQAIKGWLGGEGCKGVPGTSL